MKPVENKIITVNLTWTEAKNIWSLADDQKLDSKEKLAIRAKMRDALGE